MQDKTTDHHKTDDAELDRLETQMETGRTGDNEETTAKKSTFLPWTIALAVIAVLVLITVLLIAAKKSSTEATVNVESGEKHEDEAETGKEVRLSPEILAFAGIETETVTQRPAIALVTVAGSVEANPQQTQQVTSLVSGRIEQVNVSIGDRVSAGQIVGTLMSTEVAESYGKWREAVNRHELAQNNLSRVKKQENRAAILEAKAKLDEAEATLKRTRRLIELGAGAGKDLISADTNYKTAKAQYDYQSSIPLNKEIQEAEAELKSAQVSALHLKQSLQALGVSVSSPNAEVRNVASVPLRAPVSGIITERTVSGGAGVQAGTSLFTISNISNVWVIANVPENQMPLLHVGTPAQIRVAALGDGTINGNISYIDPQLNEETRTGRVRIEVPNTNERLKSGMFVEVGFQGGTGAATGQELVVPSAAVQQLGERTIVFVPKEDEPGAFEIREIEVGSMVEGYHRVLKGLQIGEKVVTKGSFTLKTQMQKEELGEHGH
jgi:cobalt-zinc-cadmium efflux system membrane fusion protein